MIIDIHTHILGAAPTREEWELFVRECRRNGVTLAIVSSVDTHQPYPEPEFVSRANRNMEALSEWAAPLTRWFAYLNPQNANWREELDDCLTRGATGIKLWISLKDETRSPARTVELCRHAGERGLPVLVHTYHRADPSYPGEFDLEEFARLAEACPDTTLIGAHTGALWREVFAILKGRAPNAYVDISGSPPDRDMVEKLTRDMGAERLIFGSDILGRSLPSQIAKVEFADITAEEKEMILWRNAARALGLDGPPPAPEGRPELRRAGELPDLGEDHLCFCGRWPFFDTPCATPTELEDLLEADGVRKAYVGDFGAIYRYELAAANDAFLEACAGRERIAPLATLSPRPQNWRQVLAAVGDGFAGGIVYPYLHNWRLDDPEHAEFFERCAERALPLWINCQLGDHRFRHAGVGPRPVSVEEVTAFVRSAPANDYVLQGLRWQSIEAALDAMGEGARFRFDISRPTDNTGGLARLLDRGALPHLVTGSEFPLRHLRQVAWTARRQ